MRSRTVIITIVVAVIALGIVATFVVISRSRAQTSWEKLQTALRAKGHELDWRKLAPTTVPDEQNYFAHPIVKELIPAKGAAAPKSAKTDVSATRPPSKIPGIELPFSMNWLLKLPVKGASPSNSLEKLEGWFAQWDDTLAGLREAAKRPHARLDGDYSNPAAMPIPDAPSVRAHAQFIVARAQVHLALGQPAHALADLDALDALMRAMNTRPAIMINTSIYIALVGMYVETVRDGLAHSLWHEEQLKGLIVRLKRFNSLEATYNALGEGELAGVGFFVANHGKELPGTTKQGKRRFSMERLGNRFQPRAWIRQNQEHHARVIDGFMEPLDPVKGRFYLAKQTEGLVALTNLVRARGFGVMLAQFSIPNVVKIAERAAANQNLLHHALIACAIELHRLEHGSLPATLDILTPKRLDKVPPDVVNGATPIYQQGTTSFTLYSVGMDGLDDSADQDLDFVWSVKKSAEKAPK